VLKFPKRAIAACPKTWVLYVLNNLVKFLSVISFTDKDSILFVFKFLTSVLAFKSKGNLLFAFLSKVFPEPFLILARIAFICSTFKSKSSKNSLIATSLVPWNTLAKSDSLPKN